MSKIDEKEAPSAEEEMDSDIVIEDEVKETEVPEQEAEESQEEQEVGATEETQETETEEVKSEVETEEEKPSIPYKRFKRQNDKVKELYAEIEALKAKVQPAEKPKTSESFRQRPTEKEFDYDQEKYQAALDKWEDERLEWKLDQRIKAEEAKKAKERAKELQSKFAKSAEELFEKDEEYRNALIQADEDGEDLSIPALVSEVMLESDVGHLIERELVINREEMLPKLRSMNDRQKLVFLGRIEAGILSKQEMGKQQPKKSAVSKAPKPHSSVPSSSSKVDPDAKLKKVYKDFSIE